LRIYLNFSKDPVLSPSHSLAFPYIFLIYKIRTFENLVIKIIRRGKHRALFLLLFRRRLLVLLLLLLLRII